jgi:hypothetical protein
MLYHHDGRDYQVAASEAARRGREKFEAMFDQGRAAGMRLIEKVHTEVPKDYLEGGEALSWVRGDGCVRMAGQSMEEHDVRPFALGQICERVGLSTRYARMLTDGSTKVKDGSSEGLLAYNLGQLYGPRKEDRYLVRTVHENVRGFLTDRYKRMDSRPLLDSFAAACQKFGLVPVESYGSDTKVTMKAMLPMVFEPVPNEVMAFGVGWSNSEFGNGTHSVWGIMMRLWCTNFAITEVGFRQVHIGSRLSADTLFSSRTHELDMEATRSALNDIVAMAVEPKQIEATCKVIQVANEQQIDPKEMLKELSKRLNKVEVDMVKDRFTALDVEQLPPGNTVWRLSNALSWVAGNMVEDVDRKVELMREAGKVLERCAKKIAA